MRTARLLALGWLFHFKMLTRSAFDGLLGVLYPLFFATVAFFMFRAGHDSRSLLYASLGAAIMGVWSSTSARACSCGIGALVADQAGSVSGIRRGS